MNLLVRLSVAGAMGILLAACGPNEESGQPAPASEALPDAAQVQPATSQAPPAVDRLRRDFHKGEYNTMVGELVDGRLVNNGKGGFLLFGPYIAFQAGTYSVSFVGDVEELPAGTTVRIDAVSHQGKVSHAVTQLDAEGGVPSLEFTLADPVPDLEVRVLAPEGARVSLESYQIDKLR